MDRILGRDLSALVAEARLAVRSAAALFLEPWTLRQLVLIAAVVGLGTLLGRLVERRVEPHVRAVHGRPRLLRFLALLLRRTHWVVAALGLWAAVVLMRATTWPSRSYLVGMAALLVTAWVVISVVSRLIRNRVAARLVAYVA